MSNKNIVAAGDRTTAEVAGIVLSEGGNAFDAAIAGSFAAMIAEPALTSAGGGGFLNAYPADGKPIMFDFFVNTPSGDVHKKSFIETVVDFGGTQQVFHIGKGSVGVPGAVAGLLHVHRRLGKMPLDVVIEPVIELAKNGVCFSTAQADLLRLLEPIITYEEIGREMFTQDGMLISGNDKLKNPKFADFLDALVREGADLFYKGEVANNILSKLREGGLIRYDDLANYKVAEREPLETPFYNCSIFGNPPPALSGILMDVTLTLLESHASKSPISVSLFARAFEITNVLRSERLKDFPSKQTEKLTQMKFFKEYLNISRLSGVVRNEGAEPNSCGSTTHISIIDKQYNAASVTTTNGVGSGIFIPETGIMMNSMLGEEDLNPEGFHQYKNGKRLSSMISPIIVTNRGKPILVTGSAGSNRIRSAVIQIIVNIMCNKMSVEEATISPRVHLEGDVLHVEPGVPEDELAKISQRYKIQRWEKTSPYFGGANTVTTNGYAGDPRRGGFAMEV